MNHPQRFPINCRLRQAPRAFTLVEMLVVIAIIAMLASLITGAAIMARRFTRNAKIGMEMKQLEMACQAYKEKFGEYPPDFTDTETVRRHLAKAFPRYQPADYTAIVNDIRTGWRMDISNFSPFNALVFFLGGQPRWRLRATADGDGGVGTPILPGHSAFDLTRPFDGFSGFSSNPQNPFDGGASHIAPLYDFDVASIQISIDAGSNNLNDIRFWPRGEYGNRTTGAIAYFRAENSNYTTDGLVSVNIKWAIDTLDTTNNPVIYPAYDSRLGTTSWINPKSFQIFSSGLDVHYATLRNPPGPNDRLAFPSGVNIGTNTDGTSSYDDITNFSGGTLEDAMP